MSGYMKWNDNGIPNLPNQLQKGSLLLLPPRVMIAINALKLLADTHVKNPKRYIDAKTIGYLIGVDENRTRIIMCTLKSADIVKSYQARSGGFRIDEIQLATTTLVEVFNALSVSIKESTGRRASDRLTNVLYDALGISLKSFLLDRE